MTAGELIERLQTFPPETPVWTEGCDCIGNVVMGVVVDPSDGSMSILLSRG